MVLSSYTIQYMSCFYDMLRGGKRFPIIFLFRCVSYTCSVNNKHALKSAGFSCFARISMCVFPYLFIYLLQFFFAPPEVTYSNTIGFTCN